MPRDRVFKSLTIKLFFIAVFSTFFYAASVTIASAGTTTNVCGKCNNNNEGGLPSCSTTTINYSTAACGQYCGGNNNGGWCSAPAYFTGGAHSGYTDVYGSKTDAGSGSSLVHCENGYNCSKLFTASDQYYSVYVDNGNLRATNSYGNTSWSDSGYCRVQLDTYDTTMGGSPTDFVVWRDPAKCLKWQCVSNSCQQTATPPSGYNTKTDCTNSGCGSPVCSHSAPGAPTNLYPNGQTLSSTSVTATWSTNVRNCSNCPNCKDDFYAEVWKSGGGVFQSMGWTQTNSWTINANQGPGLYYWHVRQGNGYDGSDWSQGSFTIANTAPPPTCAISANPQTVNFGSASMISWSSTNATSCSVSPPNWSGTSGSQSTGALTSSQTYNLSCTGASGSCSTATTVVVIAPTCTVSVVPNSVNLNVYGSQSVTATASITGSGTVSSWSFVSGNIAVTTVSPATSTSGTFTVYGASSGATNVSTTATLSTGGSCTGSTAVTVGSTDCTNYITAPPSGLYCIGTTSNSYSLTWTRAPGSYAYQLLRVGPSICQVQTGCPQYPSPTFCPSESYNCVLATDPHIPPSYISLSTSQNSYGPITGLTSNTMYYNRVAAVCWNNKACLPTNSDGSNAATQCSSTYKYTDVTYMSVAGCPSNPISGSAHYRCNCSCTSGTSTYTDPLSPYANCTALCTNGKPMYYGISNSYKYQQVSYQLTSSGALDFSTVTRNCNCGGSSSASEYGGYNCGPLCSATATLSYKDVITSCKTAATASYYLTVAKSGTGTGTVNSTSSPTQASQINCGTTCAVLYNSGTNVTLSASPALGSTFTGWSGGVCSGTGTCTVPMTQAWTVTAAFASAACTGATPATADWVTSSNTLVLARSVNVYFTNNIFVSWIPSIGATASATACVMGNSCTTAVSAANQTSYGPTSLTMTTSPASFPACVAKPICVVQKPGPPTPQTASGITVSGATVSWTAPTAKGCTYDGTTCTGCSYDYNVAYGLNINPITALNGTSWQLVGSAGTEPTPLSYTLSNLSCGTTYHYRIKRGVGGTYSGVESDWSADATFTTSPCVNAFCNLSTGVCSTAGTGQSCTTVCTALVCQSNSTCGYGATVDSSCSGKSWGNSCTVPSFPTGQIYFKNADGSNANARVKVVNPPATGVTNVGFNAYLYGGSLTGVSINQSPARNNLWNTVATAPCSGTSCTFNTGTWGISNSVPPSGNYVVAVGGSNTTTTCTGNPYCSSFATTGTNVCTGQTYCTVCSTQTDCGNLYNFVSDKDNLLLIVCPSKGTCADPMAIGVGGTVLGVSADSENGSKAGKVLSAQTTWCTTNSSTCQNLGSAPTFLNAQIPWPSPYLACMAGTVKLQVRASNANFDTDPASNYETSYFKTNTTDNSLTWLGDNVTTVSGDESYNYSFPLSQLAGLNPAVNTIYYWRVVRYMGTSDNDYVGVTSLARQFVVASTVNINGYVRDTSGINEACYTPVSSEGVVPASPATIIVTATDTVNGHGYSTTASNTDGYYELNNIPLLGTASLSVAVMGAPTGYTTNCSSVTAPSTGGSKNIAIIKVYKPWIQVEGGDIYAVGAAVPVRGINVPVPFGKALFAALSPSLTCGVAVTASSVSPNVGAGSRVTAGCTDRHVENSPGRDWTSYLTKIYNYCLTNSCSLGATDIIPVTGSVSDNGNHPHRLYVSPSDADFTFSGNNWLTAGGVLVGGSLSVTADLGSQQAVRPALKITIDPEIFLTPLVSGLTNLSVSHVIWKEVAN